MITVVTGIRSLSEASIPDVELAMIDALADSDEVRFGGARGSDTIALLTACEYAAPGETRLRVFVPFDLDAQPREARDAAECADDVIELSLPRRKASYLRRNAIMLDGAARALAFTDGRENGGTTWTVRHAEAFGLDVQIVPVLNDAESLRPNPLLPVPGELAPIHAMAPYRRAHDRATKTILDLKAGEVDPDDLDWLASETAMYIHTHLPRRRYVAPMPRSDPAFASDLLPLVEAIARILNIEVLPDWIVRREKPHHGGFREYKRLRYPAEEHARTLIVGQGQNVSVADVLLLDNVLTVGGTMLGAQQAALRDVGAAPLCFAVLWGQAARRDCGRATR